MKLKDINTLYAFVSALSLTDITYQVTKIREIEENDNMDIDDAINKLKDVMNRLNKDFNCVIEGFEQAKKEERITNA